MGSARADSETHGVSSSLLWRSVLAQAGGRNVFRGHGAKETCPVFLRPKPVHLGRSFEKPYRGCIEAWPYQSMPSPGPRRLLVAGEGVQELRVLPQETVCPGAPPAVVPWARSSPEVGSQVQGG